MSEWSNSRNVFINESCEICVENFDRWFLAFELSGWRGDKYLVKHICRILIENVYTWSFLPSIRQIRRLLVVNFKWKTNRERRFGGQIGHLKVCRLFKSVMAHVMLICTIGIVSREQTPSGNPARGMSHVTRLRELWHPEIPRNQIPWPYFNTK